MNAMALHESVSADFETKLSRTRTLLLKMLRVPSTLFAVNKLDAVADAA